MQLFKKIIVGILTFESRLIVRKYKPFIVAVTGSVGKTSTKDAIYDVLKDQSHFVRKSEKSMNSEIGLPLTIIGAPNAWHSLGGWIQNIGKGLGLIFKKSSYPDCLILEIGADHPGDIKSVAKWLHPDISVITRISHRPVHVEFFKSPDEVFEEKAALATAVKSHGTLVLFADDEKILTLAERVKERNVKVITYGMNENATVRGVPGKIIYEINTISQPVGFDFTVNLGGEVQTVIVKRVIGNVYMYPLLVAAAVGQSRGISPEKIVKLLNEFDAPKGRMNLIAGINDSTIIDDTYNSSPDATMSALETLKGLECSGTKIAVLGDMMELGKFAGEEHRRVGKELVGIVSRLITVGRRSQLTADEAIKNGFSKEAIHCFDTSLDAAAFLIGVIKSGDIILVKGSQSIRMERVVSALLKEPAKADRLLVRQEKEWLKKK